jgi:hypothetical protein
MEKRSRRRTRDLVALAASQGLSENEIGCARISMMARSTNAPCKGRIQKRKTTLHLLKSGLQRTAGPYKSANFRSRTFKIAKSKRPEGDSAEIGAGLVVYIGLSAGVLMHGIVDLTNVAIEIDRDPMLGAGARAIADRLLGCPAASLV